MNSIVRVDNCCGCRACEHSCPAKCITFVKNAEGFLCPSLEESQCLNCGSCLKVCPQFNNIDLNEPSEVYAAITRDADLLKKSTSGGAMSVFAKNIIELGGVVFGSVLNTKDWLVSFDYTETLNGLAAFRGSKYVQSDTVDSYKTVFEMLKKDRWVMFVGTPCQVAGLKMFLTFKHVSQEKLFAVDILCHGVPSPTLFIEHVKYSEQKYRQKLIDFSFRDKTVFPNKTALKYVFPNKTIVVLGRCDTYFEAFISGSSYRDCCYSCKFATHKRIGDVSLGDYWGIKKHHPDFDSSNGVSLILVNTERGKQMLEKSAFDKTKSSLAFALETNGILKNPSSKSDCRDIFYSTVNEDGYYKATKKLLRTKSMLYNWLLTHLPKSVIKKLSKR